MSFASIYESLLNKTEYLTVVGLGYVGLPVALAFSKKINVIGYDINKEKIESYKAGIDNTQQFNYEDLHSSSVEFTDNEADLNQGLFHIIAVPTPITEYNTPDLLPVVNASKIVGKHMRKGSIVVYESTVYPGVTEEVCVPLLERSSNLKYGKDFKVGYSPERVNVGDRIHRLETIVKIVSGMDRDSLDTIARVYKLIVKDVYRAETIRIAEAAKVVENSQRDVNIAFMNELSKMFHVLKIDTKQVLAAAATKWNFLNFTPGLVGGHCISVDPYYLVYKSKVEGYSSQLISSGREVNDSMGEYVAENTLKLLIDADILVKNAKVAILGFSFKENCSDVRNTKVIDIYRVLLKYGIDTRIVDPCADIKEAKRIYDVSLYSKIEINDADAVIIAVPHKEILEIPVEKLKEFYNPINHKKILLDVKGIFCEPDDLDDTFVYWRL